MANTVIVILNIKVLFEFLPFATEAFGYSTSS